jgi:transcription elongation factor Elf1
MDRLRIQVDKGGKEVIALCSCGLEYSLDYVQSFESIDYYNKLIDEFNKK